MTIQGIITHINSCLFPSKLTKNVGVQKKFKIDINSCLDNIIFIVNIFGFVSLKIDLIFKLYFVIYFIV